MNYHNPKEIKIGITSSLFLVLFMMLFIKTYIEYNVIWYGNVELGLKYFDVEQMRGIAPFWYSYLTLLIYLCIVLIIIIFLLRLKYFKINSTMFMLYFLMILWMWIVLLFLTEEPLKYLTSVTYASERMAPGTIIAIGLFFIAYQNTLWKQIMRWIPLLILVSSLLFIYGLTQMEYVNRFISFKWVKGPGQILTLLSIVYLGMKIKQKSILVYIPIFLSILTGIITQTRLSIIMYLFNLFLFLHLYSRSIDISLKSKKRIKVLFFATLLILIMSIGLSFWIVIDPSIRSSLPNIPGMDYINAFSGRLLEDTRTEQATNFFSYFFQSLPFGIGYPSEWENSGLGENGIDNGYLNTMYVTGIPMVILLILLLVVPSFRALFLRLPGEDLAIATVAVTRAIWLLTSATTMLTFDFVVFILFAGRCAYLYDKYRRKSIL